jgi:hypothetical protein
VALAVAMASPRDPVLDRLHARTPILRKLLWTLPAAALPKPKRTVWALAVDGTGTVVHDLQGTHESFTMVTGVREVGGTVYLGSLVGTAVAAFDLG